MFRFHSCSDFSSYYRAKKSIFVSTSGLLSLEVPFSFGQNFLILMKRKNQTISLIVVLILALVTVVVKKCKTSVNNYPERTITVDHGDWRHHKLVYTSHAKCRMECREISESEVEFILANGVVNTEKSREMDDEAAGHCPTYALEGNTNDGQHVRIVYGACDKITKVITAIDLGVEHSCNCR